jgi:hypothetical protein
MKHTRNYIIITFLIITTFLTYFLTGQVYAGNLSSISDTLSRIQVAEDANHSIEFVTPTGVDASSDTIVLTFDDTGDAFNLSGVTVGDIDLAVDDDGQCDGTWTDKTLASSASAGQWGVNVNTSTDVITLSAPTDSTTGEISAGRCVQIEIGMNADSGANAINNPASPGTYTVDISGTFGDTGAFALNIVSDDQIDISASVDPTLDVIIGSTSCILGTLSANYIETCSYDVTVSTNATSGYTATIVSDGLLRNDFDDINNAAGGTVEKGSEEYGIGTSKSGQDIIQNSVCTDHDTGSSQPASALTTSAQQFASSTAPISKDITTMCHLASVSGATPAGSYNQVATIVVTSYY